MQSIIVQASLGTCKFPESKDHVLVSSEAPMVPGTASGALQLTKTFSDNGTMTCEENGNLTKVLQFIFE